MPKRKFYRKIYQPGEKKRKFWFFLKLLGFGFLTFLMGAVFLFIYYAKDLPRPEKFTERQIIQSTKIYDRTGEILLYEIYGEEKRTYVLLDKIPEYLQQAVIATEDANFYQHFGVDFKGIGRAILFDLSRRKAVYGGSTIPQQLIRSTFLSPEKTAERKTREIILAIELDRRYSKKQILEWYLNQIPFGQNTYGVEAASQTYFNKSVSEISLAEAATLAALIQAPSHLSPYGEYKEELLTRKNYVLERMAGLGYITQENKETAKKEELKFAKILQPIRAPYFVMYIKDYLIENYGEDFLKERGLKVYTTLDWELQDWAEKVILEKAKANEKSNAFNAALVTISPKTGEILAMVGGKDWFADPQPKDCKPGINCLFESKVNVATYRIGRQPGSSFKPFIYATAFKKGYNDKTQILDELTNFGIWGGKEYIPQNYDEKFHGLVSLRDSLAQSLNIPSIKVLYLAGAENKTEKLEINDFSGQEKILEEGLKESLETARQMGITTLEKPLSFYGPALVLGGGEVKLLEMVSAYGVFATDGLKIPPVSILKIEDSKGNIIEENKKNPQRVLEKEVCRLVNDILSDNTARAPLYGSASSLFFENYQVAAKTGTTNDYKDAWVIGYTPSIVTGVWVGNNNGSPMVKKAGITLTGPIFHSFMEKAISKYPKENFEKPSSPHHLE